MVGIPDVFPEIRGVHWSGLLLAHHHVLSCERHQLDDDFCRYDMMTRRVRNLECWK